VEVRQQLVADPEARYQPGDRLAPPSPSWPRPTVAERLEIPLGAPVLAVERVIRADDVPAAHALDVLPEAVLAAAGSVRYEGGSVDRFLEERCGLELAGGMADVTATSAGRGLARLLGVSPGAAVPRMEQVERTAEPDDRLLKAVIRP
jgi:GntR family transcriptional regulator